MYWTKANIILKTLKTSKDPGGPIYVFALAELFCKVGTSRNEGREVKQNGSSPRVQIITGGQ